MAPDIQHHEPSAPGTAGTSDAHELESEQRVTPGGDAPVGTAALLQNMMLDSADVHEFLADLTTLAAQHLSAPGQDILVGVTLLRPRTNGTVASSSDTAQHMDELQYAFGDGPCLTAAHTQTIVSVPDVDRDHRWPEYLTAISAHGARSILAVPIPLEVEASSALNLYSMTPNAFDTDSVRTAQSFAREASQCLRLAVRIAHLTDTGQNLTTAMESRTTIDLAAGIIMAQNRCSQEQAMMILKAASSARNIKLRDVAAAVVTSVIPDNPTTHFDR